MNVREYIETETMAHSLSLGHYETEEGPNTLNGGRGTASAPHSARYVDTPHRVHRNVRVSNKGQRSNRMIAHTDTNK